MPIDRSGPYVILLTDRRALGRPIVFAASSLTTTENVYGARRFRSELDALNWWLQLDPEQSPVKVRYTPTVTRLEGSAIGV